jgi:hypothetical protein
MRSLLDAFQDEQDCVAAFLADEFGFERFGDEERQNLLTLWLR